MWLRNRIGDKIERPNGLLTAVAIGKVVWPEEDGTWWEYTVLQAHNRPEDKAIKLSRHNGGKDGRTYEAAYYAWKEGGDLNEETPNFFYTFPEPNSKRTGGRTVLVDKNRKVVSSDSDARKSGSRKKVARKLSAKRTRVVSKPPTG